MTVDASITLRQLMQRVANESEQLYVAIRRTEGNDTYWYTWTVEDLGFVADGASDSTLDADLTAALNLHEYEAVNEYTSGTADNLSNLRGVLIRGDQAVGVLRPEGETMRGGGLESLRSGAAPRPGGGSTTRDSARRALARQRSAPTRGRRGSRG